MASFISTQACLVDQILPPIKSGAGRSLLRDNTSLKRLLSNASPTDLQTTPTTQVEGQATSPKHPPPAGEFEKKQEEVTAKHNPSYQPPLDLPSDKSTNAESPGQLPRELLGNFRRWRQESRHGRQLPRYISIIPKDQLVILDPTTAWQPPLVGQPNLPGEVPPNLLQTLLTKAEGRSDNAQPQPSLPNTSLPPQKQAAEQSPPALPEHPEDDSDDATLPWSLSPPTQDRRTRLASLAGSKDLDDPLSGTDGEDVRDDLPPDSSPPQLPGFMKNKTTFLPKPRSQLKAASECRDDKDLHDDKNEQKANGIIDPHANSSPGPKDLTQPNHAKSHKAPERRKSFNSPSQELGVDSPCVVIPELKESTVIPPQDIHMGGAHAHFVGRAPQRIQVEQTPHTGKEVSADQRAIQHVYQPARHRSHPTDEPVSTACVPGTFDEATRHGGIGRSQPSPDNDPAVSGSGQETKLQHQTSTHRYDFAQNQTPPKARSEAHAPSASPASKPLASSDQRIESMQTGIQLQNQEMFEDHEIGSSPPDNTILPGSSHEPSTDTHGLIRPQSYVYTLPQSAKQSTSNHEVRRKRPSDEQEIRSFNKQPRTGQMLPSSSIWDPDLAIVAQESRSHRREYLTKFKKPSIHREGPLVSRVEGSASSAAPRPMAGPALRERMSSQSFPSFRTSIPHSDRGDEEEATVRTQRTSIAAPQVSQQVNEELFEEYQAAYPDYAGSLPHFHQAIQLLKRTSLSGKGFHPYLFDDAIFHHYHAYRAYKADEVDDCENAMSFHNFYNQRIMSPSHVSGLITLEALRSGTFQARVPNSRKRQLSIDSDENEISQDSEYDVDESWSGSHDRLMSHTQNPREQLSRRRLGAESPDLGTPLPQTLQSSVPRPDLPAVRVSSQIKGTERSKAARRSDPFPLSAVQTPESLRRQMSKSKTPRTLPKTFTTTTSSSLQRAAPTSSRKLSAAVSLESKAERSPSPILPKSKAMQQWWQEADTPFKRLERQMRSLPGEQRDGGRAWSDVIDQGINIFTWRS